MLLICVKREAEYFSTLGWTAFCLPGKSPEGPKRMRLIQAVD
jgi:hypothetical protein